MGVVDELVRARAEFERGEWAAALERWSSVDPDGLTATDLESAGSAAQLLGRPDDAVARYRRAFEARLEADDPAGAARCAFHLTMVLRMRGDPSAASGWLARDERLADELSDDSVEAGYLDLRPDVRPPRSGESQGLDCAERQPRQAPAR